MAEMSSIASILNAYNSGKMSPIDAKEFEEDVNAGKIMLPRGGKLKPVETIKTTVQETVKTTTQEPIKPTDPELSQAVETVVKYFSDAITNSVEKKVAEKLEQHNTDTMQNGFDSLNQEVNKMAVGGKKTRKFRITNKNKSIHKRL
jgi:hypothetical protein